MSRRRRSRQDKRGGDYMSTAGTAIGWCVPEQLPAALAEAYREAAAQSVAQTGQPSPLVLMDLPSLGVIVAVVTDERDGERFMANATRIAGTFGLRIERGRP
jgi:hypothetical protein